MDKGQFLEKGDTNKFQLHKGSTNFHLNEKPLFRNNIQIIVRLNNGYI